MPGKASFQCMLKAFDTISCVPQPEHMLPTVITPSFSAATLFMLVTNLVRRPSNCCAVRACSKKSPTWKPIWFQSLDLRVDKPTKYWPWKKSQPQGFKICSDSFRQGTPHPWPVKGGNIVCFSGLSTVSSTFPRLSASLSGKMSRELEGLRRTAWTGLGG